MDRYQDMEIQYDLFLLAIFLNNCRWFLFFLVKIPWRIQAPMQIPVTGVWTSSVWMKTMEGRHLRWWDFRNFCVTVSMNGMMVRWYGLNMFFLSGHAGHILHGADRFLFFLLSNTWISVLRHIGAKKHHEILQEMNVTVKSCEIRCHFQNMGIMGWTGHGSNIYRTIGTSPWCIAGCHPEAPSCRVNGYYGNGASLLDCDLATLWELWLVSRISLLKISNTWWVTRVYHNPNPNFGVHQWWLDRRFHRRGSPQFHRDSPVWTLNFAAFWGLLVALLTSQSVLFVVFWLQNHHVCSIFVPDLPKSYPESYLI